MENYEIMQDLFNLQKTMDYSAVVASLRAFANKLEADSKSNFYSAVYNSTELAIIENKDADEVYDLCQKTQNHSNSFIQSLDTKEVQLRQILADFKTKNAAACCAVREIDQEAHSILISKQ